MSGLLMKYVNLSMAQEKELAESKRREAELQRNYDAANLAILHMDARVKTLEDALRDEISEVAARAGTCQARLIERCVCFKCRRDRSKQALAAKEKP